MNKLDFVRKLYRGKNCYSDPLTPEEIELIHIRSTTENIISQMLEDKKIFIHVMKNMDKNLDDILKGGN